MAKSSQDAGPTLAPFNPTSDDAMSIAVELLGPVTADDVVWDIGCGDGRFLTAVCAETGSGFGVEISAELAARAEAKVSASAASNRIRILCQDALQVDFSSATVLLLYLVPKGLAALAPKLNALAEGDHKVRVVANFFSVPGWTPVKQHIDGRCRLHYYEVGGSAAAAPAAASTCTPSSAACAEDTKAATAPSSLAGARAESSTPDETSTPRA